MTKSQPKKLASLTVEGFKPYLKYTQHEAAKMLGVSKSTLKRRFYELTLRGNILELGKSWPNHNQETKRKMRNTNGNDKRKSPSQKLAKRLSIQNLVNTNTIEEKCLTECTMRFLHRQQQTQVAQPIPVFPQFIPLFPSENAFSPPSRSHQHQYHLSNTHSSTSTPSHSPLFSSDTSQCSGDSQAVQFHSKRENLRGNSLPPVHLTPLKTSSSTSSLVGGSLLSASSLNSTASAHGSCSGTPGSSLSRGTPTFSSQLLSSNRSYQSGHVTPLEESVQPIGGIKVNSSVPTFCHVSP